MNFIEKIRNRPQAEKIRIIWTIVAIIAILLIGLWIISSRMRKDVPKDTTLFQQIGKSVRDLKDNYGK